MDNAYGRRQRFGPPFPALLSATAALLIQLTFVGVIPRSAGAQPQLAVSRPAHVVRFSAPPTIDDTPVVLRQRGMRWHHAIAPHTGAVCRDLGEQMLAHVAATPIALRHADVRWTDRRLVDAVTGEAVAAPHPRQPVGIRRLIPRDRRIATLTSVIGRKVWTNLSSIQKSLRRE